MWPERFTSAGSRVLPFLQTQPTIEEIAERDGRRRSTVKAHLAHMHVKLGVSTRTGAVECARELGLRADPSGSALALIPAQRTQPSQWP